MISIFVAVLLSFSTGITVASAIFAFISVIGLLPRFIGKTGTTKKIMFYENIIVVAGVVSALIYTFDIQFNISKVIMWYYMFCLGIFVGSLAVCLTEVIDVLPVVAKFSNFKTKVKYIILTIAIAKGFGAFIFYYYILS